MPIAHLLIYVRDSQISKSFYEKLLKPLNYVVAHESEKMVGFSSAGEAPDFWLAVDTSPKVEHKRAHFAFQAAGKEDVHDFHAAGLCVFAYRDKDIG
jgi:hypothetical protein